MVPYPYRRQDAAVKQEKGEGGRFLPKGEKKRKMRHFRLTDGAWEAIKRAAAQRQESIADLVELWASEGSPTLQKIAEIASQVLADPAIVRPRDRAAVRRAIEKILECLRAEQGEPPEPETRGEVW